MQIIKVGFIGAGGIARAHAYSLNSLKYYYDRVPKIIFESVSSARRESREKFAKNYGFNKAQDLADFEKNTTINTVFILGPNNSHYEHLMLALNMPEVKYIYLEKPVCASEEEEKKMANLIEKYAGKVIVQVGFQYLQTPAVREAFNFWRSGKLGDPIHFDLKYYHGDYLQPSYRNKRQTRLTPAPDGGAMADLGSHGISLLVAFFGKKLQITGAYQSGCFEDVPIGSDLFSSISLFDPRTKMAGQLSASRISSGTGDMVQFEIYGKKGALRYSSHTADYFEYYLEESKQWVKKVVGSNYFSITGFPSGHVSPGWLRAMVHAHYIFLSGDDPQAFMPDLKHGLAVQRIVRETASYLQEFRNKNYEV